MLHLLTLKRFQAEFNNLETLKRFIDIKDPSFNDLRSIFSCFIKLSEINNESDRLIREAKDHPMHFVIKTSKEAGEGNYFDPD